MNSLLSSIAWWKVSRGGEKLRGNFVNVGLLKEGIVIYLSDGQAVELTGYVFLLDGGFRRAVEGRIKLAHRREWLKNDANAIEWIVARREGKFGLVFEGVDLPGAAQYWLGLFPPAFAERTHHHAAKRTCPLLKPEIKKKS